jgi:hypothetical protein
MGGDGLQPCPARKGMPLKKSTLLDLFDRYQEDAELARGGPDLS